MPLAGYMWCGSLEFLIPVCVAALILVLAEAVLQEVLAEFCLVLGLDLIVAVLELAVLALLALILEEVSADSLSLDPEEVLHLALAADIHGDACGFVRGSYGYQC